MELAILGSSGKMGGELKTQLEKRGYAAALEINSATKLPVDLSKIKTVLDFSTPKALMQLLPQLEAAGCALVSGTTGFSEKEMAKLHAAAKMIPILYARNFSRGVNVLELLARSATRLLGKDADIEIVERHHKYKKDAPSGTALHLGEAIARERGERLTDITQHGRSGKNLAREREIAFHAIRGGNIVGDHDLHFILKNEEITLSHHAANRSIFAEGAVAALPFIMAKKNGFYTYQDMLEEELK
jgi:4-hydroxy-tetrahydrodipicolinate reductase